MWMCAGKAQGSIAVGKLAAQGLWGGITVKMGDFSLHSSRGGLPPISAFTQGFQKKISESDS